MSDPNHKPTSRQAAQLFADRPARIRRPKVVLREWPITDSDTERQARLGTVVTKRKEG